MRSITAASNTQGSKLPERQRVARWLRTTPPEPKARAPYRLEATAAASVLPSAGKIQQELGLLQQSIFELQSNDPRLT